MIIGISEEVQIPVANIVLEGELVIPDHAKAIIVFSHGSGSSRFSSRNKAVAKYLQERNFGTLLLDLLTKKEEEYYYNRFRIEFLAKRLTAAAEWVTKLPSSKKCRIGFFGASTGAASALKAATVLPEVFAIVSRGGRPDLAFEDLPKVKAPTLLIVGGWDTAVLALNERAYDTLTCEKKLEIVPGATHLFEEKGKLEIVSRLAGNWFEQHLKSTKKYD